MTVRWTVRAVDRARRSELAAKQTGGVSYPKKHTPSDLAFASATSL